jgi:hypothetical protein
MLTPPTLAPDETAMRSVSGGEPFKGDAISMHDQTRRALALIECAHHRTIEEAGQGVDD